jgi:Ca2+-binding EF-hand superfamily protein
LLTLLMPGILMLGMLLGRSPLQAAEPTAQPTSERLFRQLDQNRDGRLELEESPGEHARLFKRLLRTADADGDGRLSLREFDQGLQPQRTAKPMAEKPPSRLPGADELLLLVAMADVDADGTIDLDEVPQRLRPFFERLKERVGGGDRQQIKARELARAAPRLTQFALATVNRLKLDVDLEYALLPDENWALVERLNGSQRRGEALTDVDQSLAMFRRLDANRDGQVVREEVPEQFAARFDRLLARADRNRDDQISEQEFRGLASRQREPEKSGSKPKRSKKQRKRKVSQESSAGDE